MREEEGTAAGGRRERALAAMSAQLAGKTRAPHALLPSHPTRHYSRKFKTWDQRQPAAAGR